MTIEPRTLDDLKTERPEITPPLPQVARLVPLVFYVALFGTIVLFALFALRIGQISSSRDEWKADADRSRRELQATKAQRGQLEARAKRASDFLVWTESARPLQPLLVDIARSIRSDASIAELALSRSTENPGQLRFIVKLNGSNPAQLDRVLAMLAQHGFRPYSPEQKLSRGEIDYQATLIWQQGLQEQAAEMQGEDL